jgi:hypothetical protein
MITKIQAILSLVPNAQVVVRGEEVEWYEPTTAPVTDAEINAEVNRLQTEEIAKEYQRNRAKEYPPMADYLDAIVKDDMVQKQVYIDACLAVKAKYPKGII